jgi:hypothetical protein
MRSCWLRSCKAATCVVCCPAGVDTTRTRCLSPTAVAAWRGRFKFKLLAWRTDSDSLHSAAGACCRLQVVMDGTMTWKPFVEQTIEMIRHIHERDVRKP